MLKTVGKDYLTVSKVCGGWITLDLSCENKMAVKKLKFLPYTGTP
jgi:hypothetical protein